MPTLYTVYSLVYHVFIPFSHLSYFVCIRIQAAEAKQSGGGVSSDSFAARAQAAGDKNAAAAPPKQN
jgi:hypothetical protein